MTRFALLVFALAGCAGYATTGGEDPRQNPVAAEPLVCASKDQCETYWQRSQVWVTSHSGYRVRHATDAVIETYGPVGARSELAYRILRTPDGKGGARITIFAGCANPLGCSPSVTAAIIAFKRFVRTGT